MRITEHMLVLTRCKLLPIISCSVPLKWTPFHCEFLSSNSTEHWVFTVLFWGFYVLWHLANTIRLSLNKQLSMNPQCFTKKNCVGKPVFNNFFLLINVLVWTACYCVAVDCYLLRSKSFSFSSDKTTGIAFLLRRRTNLMMWYIPCCKPMALQGWKCLKVM